MNKDTKILTLVRGIPGSGKTTFAETMAALSDAKVFSADMYFEDNEGNYNFDANQLGAAHKWCEDNVDNLMSFGRNVFVANTFTREREMKKYYELATKHGYKVFSIIVENRHGNINIHKVPAETLIKMRERFNIKL